MKPSIDPEKAAQREELARQMAEFEARHGPVESLPTVIRDDEPVCSILSDMQRRRGKKGLASRHSK